MRNCNTYRVKLLEHPMKIAERVLERNQELVHVNSMQFGFMPGRGTTEALFVVRRIQEKHRDKKKKLYMCFVNIEKAFDRIPRKVMEWAMRKKGLPEVIVRAVISFYHGAKTKVREGSELSQEFLVQVGAHRESVLSSLPFAIAVNVISENAREGLINEILYANDLVLMSESMENLREVFKILLRSAMLYGSETRCLRENKMAILRTEKAMMRAMYGVKIIEKRSQELMSLLGLEDNLDGLARASGVRWYGHVLRRNNSDALRSALDFEVA